VSAKKTQIAWQDDLTSAPFLGELGVLGVSILFFASTRNPKIGAQPSLFPQP